MGAKFDRPFLPYAHAPMAPRYFTSSLRLWCTTCISNRRGDPPGEEKGIGLFPPPKAVDRSWRDFYSLIFKHEPARNPLDFRFLGSQRYALPQNHFPSFRTPSKLTRYLWVCLRCWIRLAISHANFCLAAPLKPLPACFPLVQVPAKSLKYFIPRIFPFLHSRARNFSHHFQQANEINREVWKSEQTQPQALTHFAIGSGCFWQDVNLKPARHQGSGIFNFKVIIKIQQEQE